jgi:uncharacterized protein (TIGR02270 family)
VNRPVIRDDLVRVHAEDAANLCHLRRLRIEAPQVRITDIFDADRRLNAHLQFLKLSGAAGLAAARALHEDAPDRGEATVRAIVGLAGGEAELAEPILDLAEDRDEAIAAVADAFGHADKEARRRFLGPWVHSDNPALVSIALEAAASYRLNLRDLLAPLFQYPDAGVRARAYAYAGVMGLIAHAPAVESAAGTETDPAARFAAHLSACRIASGATAEGLLAMVGPDLPPDRCREAVEAGFLGLGQARAREVVRQMLSVEETRRWGVLGLGVIGAARVIDFLIAEMARPTTARMAGWAFAMITGANVAEDGLELDVFPESPEDPTIAASPLETFLEESLPWPDPARIGAWMAGQGNRLAEDQPLLFGLARWSYRDMDSPDQIFQARYRAVAQAIAMQTPGSPLPNWRTPVRLQGRTYIRDWQV